VIVALGAERKTTLVGRRYDYGLGFGLLGPGVAGVGGGAAKNGGIAGFAAGWDGPAGLSERKARAASPAQMLSRYCVRIASQTRRASSL
jgi:hypothetical protein